ncbi:MAG: GAF domain-containing protein, partial [Afipia birgiae]|nr:GAF domain-containing protein [Afipia birgiae]
MLVETCARLAATGDVPALLDAVLNGVIAAIPAYSTTYFSCDAEGTITPATHASRDPRDPRDTLERCRAAHPPLSATSPVVRQFARPGGSEGHILLSLDRPEHRALVRGDSLAWHDRFGIKWVLVCPMHVGARVLGYVGVRTADPAGFSATDAQTLEALAEQLALAARTAELADEARGRAVEEERRRLAEDRAREASATNETLLRTLSGLVTQQDSDV